MKFITQENGSIKVIAETEEEKESFRAEAEFWDNHGCKCEEETDAHYVDDNTPDALVMKHHWVCIECQGVKQIG